MSRGLRGPRGTVEFPNTVAPVSPVPVSGRVESQPPRPDTTTLADRLLADAILFGSISLALVALSFIPAWLASLI